jgi:hypothetical protein
MRKLTDNKIEAFADDFSTWVYFYGPEGGESDAPTTHPGA